MKKIKKFILNILYRPKMVFLLCLLFLFFSLVVDGSLFQLFGLSRDLRVIRHRIEYIKAGNQNIEQKIKKANDPDFVEKESRQRLDYTGEGDLIFIFPENI